METRRDKLGEVKSSPTPWSKVKLNRRDQVKLIRLRIGHSWFSQSSDGRSGYARSTLSVFQREFKKRETCVDRM